MATHTSRVQCANSRLVSLISLIGFSSLLLHIPPLQAQDSVIQLSKQPDTTELLQSSPLPAVVGDSLVVSETQEPEPAPLLASTQASVVHSSSWRRFADSLSMPWVALSSILLPGAGQALNGDYWKIPLVTGSVTGFTLGSIYFHRKYTSLHSEPFSTNTEVYLQQESRLIELQAYRNGCIAAAALSYSLGVADAMFVHSRDFKSPLAALLSSALLPGLGQMYTQTYWKVPIIYGAAVFLTSQYLRMDLLYRRFDKALTYLIDDRPDTIDEFEGKRSRQDIEYFRDYYRRNRDLNILGLSLLYVLNIIDAYVGAHLYYWNVDNNLAMRVYPSLPAQINGIPPTPGLAMNFDLNF